MHLKYYENGSHSLMECQKYRHKKTFPSSPKDIRDLRSQSLTGHLTTAAQEMPECLSKAVRVCKRQNCRREGPADTAQVCHFSTTPDLANAHSPTWPTQGRTLLITRSLSEAQQAFLLRCFMTTLQETCLDPFYKMK